MLNYYQPYLLPFLQLRQNKLPSGVKYFYYHSFEDALWDLIQHKFKKKHLRFLVPDFYCSSVLDNLKQHGHKYTYYKLDNNFQITTVSFKKYLWLFKPDVVVIFHVAGITSNLMADTGWLSDLPSQALIVEDSVHRLVNPAELSFLNERHFVIDSLRKVSPLPGSRLFGMISSLDFKPASGSFLSAYYLKSAGYYFMFRVCFLLGFLMSSARVVTWTHNTLLKKYDGLIGGRYRPQPELEIFKLLVERLNYERVEMVKAEQVRYYEQRLGKHGVISKMDEGKLHVFPLVYDQPPQAEVTDLLNSKGIPVWYKFTDAPWSSRYSVLFLPVGFHVDREQMDKLIDNLNSSSLRGRTAIGER